MSAVKSFLLVAAALLTLLTCAGWLDPYADTINRANLLLREGNYDEALRLYENSVVERPGDLTGRLNSAIARRRRQIRRQSVALSTCWSRSPAAR